jgi:thioredoxin reductase (NADPH)
MFPKLDEAQIARLVPLGHYRRIAAGEILYNQGDVKRGFYVLIEGRLEIVSPSPQGEMLLRVHEGGEFTGELDMLTGRRSLVRVRATADSQLLEIDIAGLRHIVQTDAELSEIFCRPFCCGTLTSWQTRREMCS